MKLILIALSLVVASCSSTSFNSEKQNCHLKEKNCEAPKATTQRMPQAFEYMSQTRK